MIAETHGVMLLVAMIIGFGMTVTIGYLGKCAYLYLFVMNAAEAKNAPKKAKTEYRIGLAVFMAGAVITFIVICWAVGMALLGVL